MVLFFTCIDDSYLVYCGLDKFENEDLIKYAFPEDVWFHADKFSSAHYYLRLKENQTIDDIPANILEDLAQMTKESSKDGKKVDNVKIVYTMASNLLKTNDMDTGQVSYVNRNSVKSTMVKTKNMEILKRLIKTRDERVVDYKAELEERNSRERNKLKRMEREAKEKSKKELEERKNSKAMRNYSTLMDKMDDKSKNGFRDEEDSDDGEERMIGRNDPTLDAFM